MSKKGKGNKGVKGIESSERKRKPGLISPEKTLDKNDGHTERDALSLVKPPLI
jgi:hypothetical protein